ncbi:MAG TPA: PIN domain-containing protein [Verrucomicrobiota bacterium]|nr:PIN domain-containing protein [Verrucomicrobiota bacterium]HNU49436.1 PIN domain-containing protein [Verrucomicrobiota bacterium]
MKVYADTSFLVKLAAHEAGSEQAMAEFRRLDFPRLVFLPLHALEVTNAIRQRAFHQRQTSARTARHAIRREHDSALGRLERWLERGWLVDALADADAAFARARTLSECHTGRLGCRAFDLLHVAFALQLGAEAFLTADRIQGEAARVEGLKVTVTPS